MVTPQPLMKASWHSTYTNFLALMDVDAGRGRDIFAHGLTHQGVVVGVQRAARLISYHLVDADMHIRIIVDAPVDDFAVL